MSSPSSHHTENSSYEIFSSTFLSSAAKTRVSCSAVSPLPIASHSCLSSSDSMNPEPSRSYWSKMIFETAFPAAALPAAAAAPDSVDRNCWVSERIIILFFPWAAAIA